MRGLRPRHFALLAALPLLIALAGCPGRPLIRVEPSPAPTPPVAPAPATPPATPAPPTPAPTPYVPNKRLEVGKIFNGMQIRTTLQTDLGANATDDREEPGSYAMDLQVRVKVPKPHHNLAELTRLNAQLPILLPALPSLLETSKISPFFDDLYRIKVTSLQQSLLRLDNLLSRHNFYDCETVLELQHPDSKRRALLMQADMDTDTDGSDSDRVPEIDGSSATFQPFTSYKWAKKTAQPNSFIPPRIARLRQLEQELAMRGLPAAHLQQLRSQQAELRSEISDLQKYSYLVGPDDPYVVLPSSMFSKKFGAFAPAVGDYCVVIWNNLLFPSVIGDVGPSDLVGEASLRICRQISPHADANNRPVNDLKATYLIFPGSADKPFDAPNLDKWYARCDALLKELGGYQGQLVAWEDLTKPKPPPATPAPATPVPVPAKPVPANGTPLPGATPKPSAAPASVPATPPPSIATPAPGATQKPVSAASPAVRPAPSQSVASPSPPSTPAPLHSAFPPPSPQSAH